MNPASNLHYLRKLAIANAIHKIPIDYQPKQISQYPSDNTHEFERWFRDSTSAVELAGKPRTYLPIFWTAYWCNNGYGRKEKTHNRLQRFVDSLPRTKKYFTICQYDDGCMVDFKDLDIKIFGMSGGRIDYPIPLLCCPHKYEFPGVEKDIFCSFVGGDTHPIRRELVKQLEGKEGYYVTMKKHSLQDYCKILARSKYALCPRGYGLSSFRIKEAIDHNAIPVYISDQFVIPYCQTDTIIRNEYDFTNFGLLYDLSWEPNPDKYLKALDVHYNDKLQSLYKNKHLFTYPGCKQKILENI